VRDYGLNSPENLQSIRDKFYELNILIWVRFKSLSELNDIDRSRQSIESLTERSGQEIYSE